jgi:hypothetical protein
LSPSLDVDEAGDLAECGKDLQAGRIHGGVPRPKGEVLVDLLEAVEGGVEDREAALDDGAVLEGVNVAGVDGVAEGAGLGTGAVAGHALTVHGLENREKKFKNKFQQNIFPSFSDSFQTNNVFTGVFFLHITLNTGNDFNDL